ncbi:hypothetical protein P5V15_011283 [Pogonomyrmex californicus]
MHDEDSFKGWLAPHPIDNKAFCNICCKAITYFDQTYKRALNITKENNNEYILSYENNNRNIFSHNDKVKHICNDPEIVSDISLARDKCKNIVINIIAKREVNKIINDLQTCKFSILIDESTDISDTKIICVLVKYLSPLNKKVTTKLLEIMSVDAKDFGMASDASVMIECNNFFMFRLKLEIPGLITFNCICHSSALIASKACEKLPESYENLIRGVNSYISSSAKRCTILVEFQDFFNIERNEILKLCNSRWLILHKCVE